MRILGMLLLVLGVVPVAGADPFPLTIIASGPSDVPIQMLSDGTNFGGPISLGDTFTVDASVPYGWELGGLVRVSELVYYPEYGDGLVGMSLNLSLFGIDGELLLQQPATTFETTGAACREFAVDVNCEVGYLEEVFGAWSAPGGGALVPATTAELEIEALGACGTTNNCLSAGLDGPTIIGLDISGFTVNTPEPSSALLISLILLSSAFVVGKRMRGTEVSK